MEGVDYLQVPRRFDDGENYKNIFAPLVKLAGEHEKRIKESARFYKVKTTWDDPPKNKIRGTLTISSIGEMPISIGDEIKIQLKDAQKAKHVFRAYVINVNLPKSEIRVQVKFARAMPPNLNDFSDINLVWNKVSHDRMLAALDRFANNSAGIPDRIYKTLLGHEMAIEPHALGDFDLKGIENFKLNESQISAVKHALQNQLTCVQGPPGTGKTVTSSLLVKKLLETTGGPILVTAPNNGSADNMTLCLAKLGINVIRLYARSKEGAFSPVEEFTLHQQVKKHTMAEQIECLKTLIDEGNITDAESKNFTKLRKKAEAEILAGAQVIAATCIGSADPRLDALKFKALIIDESAQSSEPESLVPITCGAQKVILIGDPNQLGPNIGSSKAAQAGLDKSLYERLTEQSLAKQTTLQVQYRMHPALSAFPSLQFYNGKLKDGILQSDREGAKDFPWPIPGKPLMFCVVEGVEVLEQSSRSYINQDEALIVIHVVKLLLEAKVPAMDICVMTPYLGQRSLVQKMLLNPDQPDNMGKVNCVSIDANQGKEYNYIILSTVRSQGKTIGFLGSKRRLNVAITRSRNGLIIIGNPQTLKISETWGAFLEHCEKEQVMVEGPETLKLLHTRTENEISEMEITTIQ